MTRRIIAVLTAALILALTCNANAGAKQELSAQARKEIARLLEWIEREKQSHPARAELVKRAFDKIEDLPVELAFEPARDCTKRALEQTDRLVRCLRAAYGSSAKTKDKN